jgi:hypothetical protein
MNGFELDLLVLHFDHSVCIDTCICFLFSSSASIVVSANVLCWSETVLGTVILAVYVK